MIINFLHIKGKYRLLFFIFLLHYLGWNAYSSTISENTQNSEGITMKKKTHFLNEFNYKSYRTNGNQVIINTNGSPKIRIDLCYPDVARIWVDPVGVFQKEPSYAVVPESWPDVNYTVSDKNTYLRILTSDLSIRVYKSPLHIMFYTPDDQTPISGERDTGGIGWSEDGGVFLYHQMSPEEHFYGLGEDNQAMLGTLDRRSTSRDMVTGQRMTRGCVTADIPVTFFMSTGNLGHGYGMFVDNSFRMEFNMGKESNDYYYWKAEGGDLLYYFMNGPSLKKVLNRYTLLTGRPSLLPLWALGYIQSKCTFYTWDELDDVINNLRKRQIPMDAMVFDADWPEHLQDFQWNQRWHGMSPEKISHYRTEGVKFILSTSGPMIKKDSPNYKDGLKKGIFATDGKGNTVTCGYYGGDLMDFTNPAMKQWLWPQLKPLYDEGIRGWWLDLTEPEGDPPQTVYKGGPRAKIHNVFSLLNSKAYYEMQTEYDPNTRPFILTRTGTAGIQKYGAVIWTGDIYSDYETLQAHCPEALNSTLSGIAAWTNDCGGFVYGLYKNDIHSHGLLYERWMQFSCFTPITRAHHVGPAAPYMFGDFVEAGCKHYLQLRYRLLPYIYSYARETYLTGSPIMQPLVFEYQDDPAVVNLKDEYLFGRELLVGPVFTEGTYVRKMYFPKGKWVDYDFGYEYEGNQSYVVSAPQNRIPVFVKSGAIIPMAPLMQYTDEKPWDPITFDIYPEGSSKFTLYQDDGKTMDFSTKNKFTQTDIQCEAKQDQNIDVTISQSNKLFVPDQYAFIFHLLSNPTTLQVDGKTLPYFSTKTRFDEGKEGWFWDGSFLKLYAKFSTGPKLFYNINIELDGKKLSRPAPPQLSLDSSEKSSPIGKQN